MPEALLGILVLSLSLSLSLFLSCNVSSVPRDGGQAAVSCFVFKRLFLELLQVKFPFDTIEMKLKLFRSFFLSSAEKNFFSFFLFFLLISLLHEPSKPVFPNRFLNKFSSFTSLFRFSTWPNFWMMIRIISVTRFCEIAPVWQNLKEFNNFCKVLLSRYLAKLLNLHEQNFLLWVKYQYVENIVPIGSHPNLEIEWTSTLDWNILPR